MTVLRAVPPRGWLGRASQAPAALAGRLQRSLLAWPLAALAGVVVLVINETSHERSMQALARLGERATATTQIQLVLRRLLDAETGQRGYLLTGRKIYLDPYEQAAADASAALDWLDTHYAQDRAMQARLQALRQQAQLRLLGLAETVQAFDAGQAERVSELLAAESRATMDAVRRLTEQLALAERQQVDSERQAVLETLRSSRIGVNLSTLAGLLALLLVLRQTAALERLNHGHAQALLDEQSRLEDEVTRRTDDLSELARHLHTVREDERSRLASALQDELGALLTTTQIELTRLRHDLRGASPEALARLDHLAQTIGSGITLKRRIIEDLRPSSLGTLGLVAALEIQAREFAERAGVRVLTRLKPLPLSDAAQITAYRLVQESLTNVAKYARASEVTVAMEPEGPLARIRVHDDGTGFDTGAVRRNAHGLMGMRYRVEAAGGRLNIVSAPGQGTRIEATLPLQNGGA